VLTKTTQKKTQDSERPCRDSNREPPEYKSRALGADFVGVTTINDFSERLAFFLHTLKNEVNSWSEKSKMFTPATEQDGSSDNASERCPVRILAGTRTILADFS
jgi:hypothetical protein